MQHSMIWPRDGVSGRDLAGRLLDVLNRLNSISHCAHGVYIEWATHAVAQLRTALHPDDLERLIQTPTYWAAVGKTVSDPRPSRVLLQEVDGRRDALRAAIETIERAADRWTVAYESTRSHLVMPDTNVLLHHPAGIEAADWHGLLSDTVRSMESVRLVIPLLVVDELDKQKDRASKIQARARDALKLVFRNAPAAVEGRQRIVQATDRHGDVTLELLMDDPGHSRLSRPDDELVRVASRLQNFAGRDVHLLTYDTGAALRAAAARVPHKRLEHRAAGAQAQQSN